MMSYFLHRGAGNASTGNDGTEFLEALEPPDYIG